MARFHRATNCAKIIIQSYAERPKSELSRGFTVRLVWTNRFGFTDWLLHPQRYDHWKHTDNDRIGKSVDYLVGGNSFVDEILELELRNSILSFPMHTISYTAIPCTPRSLHKDVQSQAKNVGMINTSSWNLLRPRLVLMYQFWKQRCIEKAHTFFKSRNRPWILTCDF